MHAKVGMPTIDTAAEINIFVLSRFRKSIGNAMASNKNKSKKSPVASRQLEGRNESTRQTKPH
jgi:hypothetical protein